MVNRKLFLGIGLHPKTKNLVILSCEMDEQSAMKLALEAAPQYDITEDWIKLVPLGRGAVDKLFLPWLERKGFCAEDKLGILKALKNGVRQLLESLFGFGTGAFTDAVERPFKSTFSRARTSTPSNN